MSGLFIFLLLGHLQSVWATANKNPQALQRTLECQMKISDKNEVEILNYEIYGCGKSGTAQVVLWKNTLDPIKFIFPAKCAVDGKSIIDALKIEFDTESEFLTVELKKRDDEVKTRRTGTVAIKGKKVSGTTECLVKY